MQFDLQTILVIVIVLITINLLFVGVYIVKVLRDVSRVVKRAYQAIDDVDRSVKDGIAKAKAMEKPLQAVAATTAAITNVVKKGGMINRATRSILGDLSKKEKESQDRKEVSSLIGDKNISDDTVEEKDQAKDKKRKFIKPKFFKKK